MTVQILTTGGTIDKEYFDAKSEYHVGEPQIQAMLRRVGASAAYEVEALFRKDSLEITDEDRSFIRSRVDASSCKRILITHGTDTMVDTARVLSACYEKTVVLVGSLSPARFRDTDAEFNIGFAFGVVQVLGPGAWIAMNGRVFRWDEVRKNREANRFERI